MVARRARVRAPLASDGPFDLLPAAGSEVLGGLPPAALAARLAGAAFELVVPALAGRVTTLRIPTRRPATARRAAPWALEERLLEAPDAFHIAVVASGEAGEWAAWAVGRRWLDAVEARLAAVGLAPAVVRPDWANLPWRSGEWSLLLNGPHSVLRHGRWKVTSVDPAGLAAFIEALLETGEAPERLRLWAPSAHIAGLAGLEAALAARGTALLRVPPPTPAALLLLATPGGPDAGVADGAAAGLVLPAAQGTAAAGPFARATPRRVALLALAAVLAMAGAAQERSALEARIAATEAAVLASAREALPPGTRLVDPATQLRRALEADAAGGGLTHLLALATPLLGQQAAPALELRALDYGAGRLELEVLAKEVLAADRLVQALAALPGLRARIAGLEGTAPRLLARISVEAVTP